MTGGHDDIGGPIPEGVTDTIDGIRIFPQDAVVGSSLPELASLGTDPLRYEADYEMGDWISLPESVAAWRQFFNESPATPYERSVIDRWYGAPQDDLPPLKAFLFEAGDGTRTVVYGHIVEQYRRGDRAEFVISTETPAAYRARLARELAARQAAVWAGRDRIRARRRRAKQQRRKGIRR